MGKLFRSFLAILFLVASLWLFWAFLPNVAGEIDKLFHPGDPQISAFQGSVVDGQPFDYGLVDDVAPVVRAIEWLASFENLLIGLFVPFVGLRIALDLYQSRDSDRIRLSRWTSRTATALLLALALITVAQYFLFSAFQSSELVSTYYAEYGFGNYHFDWIGAVLIVVLTAVAIWFLHFPEVDSSRPSVLEMFGPLPHPAPTTLFWVALSLAWLWWFTSGLGFLILLVVPVLASFVLAGWKRLNAFELFDPLVFSFVHALSLVALAATVYRFSFDLVFHGFLSAVPAFAPVPAFLLCVLGLAAYAMLCLDSLKRAGVDVLPSSFFLSNVAATVLAYGVSWAIFSGGLLV